MKKLSEQQAEDSIALFEQHKDDTGVNGAAIRLSMFMSAHNVTQWIRQEAERGTAPDEIGTAIVRVMTSMLIQSSGLFGARNGTTITVLLNLITQRVQAFMAGKIKLGAVEVDPVTGVEREVTIEGVLKNK